MSWKAEYVILIMVSTLIDYFAGWQIHKAITVGRKKFFLCVSLLSNLGLLFAFKYFNFFNDSVRALLAQFSIPFHPMTLNVLLPVGISFYTFQTLSYTIDLYRGKIEPEKHLGIFAVYVAFFPQLVAGPIERAKNLLPQFFEKHNFDYKRVTDGLKLMLWGFFKKVVIADRLAVVVDQVFNNVGDYTGIPLIMATVFFAFQIFCDFSGYSDIAIGSAQVLGFKLMDNFKRPYFARSVNDFWKRWHISLSSWFKDYLYIPLGGNKVAVPRWYANLLIVFLVSGLWHGANWTFVMWGAVHGVVLVLSIITSKMRKRVVDLIGLAKFPKFHTLIKIGITFVIVNLSWVFFRANSISDAFYVLTHMFTNLTLNLAGVSLGGVGIDGLFIAVSSIILMEIVHIGQEFIHKGRGEDVPTFERRGIRMYLSARPTLVRWGAYAALLAFVLLFGVFELKQFIYFQF